MKFSLSGLFVLALAGQAIAELPYKLPDYRRDHEVQRREILERPNVDTARWVPAGTGTGGYPGPLPTTFMKKHYPVPPPPGTGTGGYPSATMPTYPPHEPTWNRPWPPRPTPW